MEHINRIVGRATEIREETVSAYSHTNIERYVVSFNSLILDKSGLFLGADAIWSSALAECSVLSEASYFMAVHGFYEEASALLRIMLEGFITRMHWQIRHRNGEVEDYIKDGKSTNDYAEWALGLTGEFPRSGEIWKTLLGELVIDAYNQKFNLKAEVEDTLRRLHKYVHGRPDTRFYGGAIRSSSLNLWFNQQHMDEWFENLRAVVVPVFVISLLEYPDLLETRTAVEFASLEPKYASQVRDILPVLSKTT